MRHAARGFTLIELLIAIGLSSMIMMIAVSAFRQASQTISLMNRMSTESTLLRTGYFLNAEDVDFWNSTANPQYPFLKGHMSDAVVNGADLGNNLDNKRIFKPVAFKKVGELNPNWVQPNDKRSWYRNYFMQSPRPYGYDRSDGTTIAGYRAKPVFGNSDSPCDSFDWNTLPIGWEPWHIWGDYTLTSNLGMKEGGTPTATDATQGARPTLMWELFQRLGHAGVYTYMPPGTINLILRPATNNTVANIAMSGSHFDKGEIPWSLTVPKAITLAPTVRFDPDTMSVPTVGDVVGNVLKHYFHGMPGSRGRLFKDPWAGPVFSFPDADYGTGNPHWFADLEQINGESFWQDMDSGWVQKQSRASVGLFIGTRFTPLDFANTNFTAGPTIDRPTRDPWLAIDKDVERQANFEQSNRTSVFARQMRDYTSSTVHIPRNITDDPAPDLGSKGASTPSLATSVLRFRQKGSDKAICTIHVQDPTTGRVVELGGTMLGATLRGARQHWGWKSTIDQPSLKPMGDVYE
ncbi:MAG: prepilin-type N-terminal cleavage/methylation domain-containing protein [Planctomycetes bacterium]|nr:prepilin-type N-terminal cleavage/methylation domain-containing protein [Planctomycetota bacterium]